MVALRDVAEEQEVTSYTMIFRIQSDANKDSQILNCDTICTGYEVPGGCTPCGTKCMMYCAGK